MATVKIGFLAMRTIAKPVATRIKTQAKDSPAFKSFCVGVAQRYHRWDTRLNAFLTGYPAPERIRPLTEAKAVELGGDFLGELIIFSVATGIILLEQYRTSLSTRRSRASVDRSLDRLSVTSEESLEVLGRLVREVEGLRERVEKVEGKVNAGWLRLGGEVGKGKERDRERERPTTTTATNGDSPPAAPASYLSWFWPFTNSAASTSSHHPPTSQPTPTPTKSQLAGPHLSELALNRAHTTQRRKVESEGQVAGPAVAGGTGVSAEGTATGGAGVTSALSGVHVSMGG